MTSGDIIHASSVAVNGQAVLITGASGSGKSALALDLMSRGAELISDDRTIVRVNQGCVIASAPKSIVGKIEARGIGILAVTPCGPCPVRLVVDLDVVETERLPKHRQFTLLGVKIDLIHKPATGNPAAAILVLLKGGRVS